MYVYVHSNFHNKQKVAIITAAVPQWTDKCLETWIRSNLWFMCLGLGRARGVWGEAWPAPCTATGRITTEKLHVDKNCFSALKKQPVGKINNSQRFSRPVVLWNSLFKLPINQTQALTYTSLCPWVFIALLCGLCFPSQTFVVSYSSHPVPLIGQNKLLVGPFLQPEVGEPFSINRYFPYTAVSGRLWRGSR